MKIIALKNYRCQQSSFPPIYYNIYQMSDKNLLSDEGRMFLEAYYAPEPSTKSIIKKKKSNPFVVPLWFWAFSAVVGLFGIGIGIFMVRTLVTSATKK